MVVIAAWHVWQERRCTACVARGAIPHRAPAVMMHPRGDEVYERVCVFVHHILCIQR